MKHQSSQRWPLIVGHVIALLGVLGLVLSACTIKSDQLAGAAVSAVQADAVQQSCYWIESVAGGKVLTIENASNAQGTRLVAVAKYNPTQMAQLWVVRADGAIVNVATGFLADVKGNVKAASTPAIVWPEQNPVQANQRWSYSDRGNGEGVLVSQLQGYVLDVSGADGVSVILFPENSPSTTNQHWHLVPAPSDSCHSSALTNRDILQQLSIDSSDLEALKLTMQNDPKNNFDAQTIAQLESIKQNTTQIQQLETQIATWKKEHPNTPVPPEIQKLLDQLAALSGNSQQDMIQLQSKIGKANQSVNMLSNLVQKFSDTKAKIVGNIR